MKKPTTTKKQKQSMLPLGVLAVSAVLTLAASTAHADIIFSEDFEGSGLSAGQFNDPFGVFSTVEAGTNQLNPGSGNSWLNPMPAELGTTFGVLHSLGIVDADLTETYAANTTYTLTFTHFRRDDLDGDGIGAQLMNSSAQEVAVQVFPAVADPGTFITRTVSVNIRPGSPYVGQTIKIRLFSDRGTDQNILQAGVDNIVLTATPSVIIPTIAEWTFDTGATSVERRTASGVAAGATVSTLNFNDSFDDAGVEALPVAPNDGIGFGGNQGDTVIFLRRANYFNDSLVPDPRPTEASYSSWASGTGSDLSSSGNAPIAFTVTADAITTITLDSLTVDWTSGNDIIFQFQEAGADPGAGVTVLGAQDGQFNIPLATPVTILPGQTKTFTINLNSGSLGTNHNIDGITLNGTTAVSNGSPYQDWALANGLTASVNDGFGENPDFDAFPNGLEWILGGITPLGFDATGELLDTTMDGSNNLVFTFKRIDESEGQATLKVQFSNDLFVSDNHEVTIGAAGAEGSPPAGVTVLVTENGAAADDVTVTIPASYAAPNGKLFGRLQATQP